MVLIFLKLLSFSHLIKKSKANRKKIVAVRCEFGQIADVLKAGIKNNINENKNKLFLSFFLGIINLPTKIYDYYRYLRGTYNYYRALKEVEVLENELKKYNQDNKNV